MESELLKSVCIVLFGLSPFLIIGIAMFAP
ncbi:hypothetical protein ACVILK_003288 [Bradyrhizobium embrapense]